MIIYVQHVHTQFMFSALTPDPIIFLPHTVNGIVRYPPRYSSQKSIHCSHPEISQSHSPTSQLRPSKIIKLIYVKAICSAQELLHLSKI